MRSRILIIGLFALGVWAQPSTATIGTGPCSLMRAGVDTETEEVGHGFGEVPGEGDWISWEVGVMDHSHYDWATGVWGEWWTHHDSCN